MGLIRFTWYKVAMQMQYNVILGMQDLTSEQRDVISIFLIVRVWLVQMVQMQSGFI